MGSSASALLRESSTQLRFTGFRFGNSIRGPFRAFLNLVEFPLSSSLTRIGVGRIGAACVVRIPA